MLSEHALILLQNPVISPPPTWLRNAGRSRTKRLSQGPRTGAVARLTMGKGKAMGKTPVLGIASACWVALALNGCASNNQGRASGQKFQPAPLVQRTPPGGSATNNNAATTGFSAT